MAASSISDYALIGNCRTAALVGRDGSIDWLCLPRFDSDACFAALVGTSDHGRWRIAPVAPVRRIRRSYRENTLVLETWFETEEGTALVVDCMPTRTAADIVRLVVGCAGTVRLRMDLVIRFAYGLAVPWVRRTEHGIMALAGPDRVRLATPVPLHGEGLTTVAEFTVSQGQSIPLVLTWSPSHGPEPPLLDAERAVAETALGWRKWASRCTYAGVAHDAVVRSLITLKALTYAPTGGMVAAPTTSLPERIGSTRNWDYRYCWLRDATFVLYALMLTGYVEEARAWSDWLLRAAAGRPADLQIMYGLAGERRLPEIVLPWLTGYHGSAPVRVGNRASEQFQLDVYGEVMDCLHQVRKSGLALSEPSWRLQRALVGFVESAWERVDEGLWEVRGPRRNFTHSKVMAWVAVDRAVKAMEGGGVDGPLERWRSLRMRIRDEILRRGFDRRLNAFVQSFDRSELDASLLMIPLVGFLPATDPRMQGTIAAIQKHLMVDGFVHRYATSSGIDGLPVGEGAFLPCTFWLADNLAMMGRTEEATRLFKRLMAVRNDVGLLPEEYDPIARQFLGNFPQAFTHVALINTAWNLSRAGQAGAPPRARA